jgi:pyruvate dehydrogenase (quinone)
LAVATVADVAVSTLRASGVKRVYGVPGDSLNGFTDALRRDRSIAWQHVRHEEAAAFAAVGEATVTGRLAVCVGSCGPGNLHLINGLYEAQRSRVPVLAIAARIPRVEIYFQETHPTELFRECSVYAELVSVSEQMPRLLEIAIRSALSGRGTAVLVVPGEVFLDQATGHAGGRAILPTSSAIAPDAAALAAAADVLNAASRVTILAGAGCEGAHEELLALAGALQAPVVHALRGKAFVEYDNPYDVGMTGLLVFSSGYRAIEHCDAPVMLGTDFPYRQFCPPARVPVLQGRSPRRAHRAPDPGRGPPRRNRQGHGRRAHSPAHPEGRHSAPGPDAKPLREGPQAARRARRRRGRRHAAAPSGRRGGDRPDRE